MCLRVTAFRYIGPGMTIFGPPVYVPVAISKSRLFEIKTNASLNKRSLLIYTIAFPKAFV